MTYKNLEELRVALLQDTGLLMSTLGPRIIPGEGPEDASIMFVGEAGGKNECEQQRPFIGDAGRLLNDTLDKAGINREKTYITNVVKARPTTDGKNRAPSTKEVNRHKDWLMQEIRLIKPRVIVGLGRIACRLLLEDDKVVMSKSVGKIFTKHYTDAILIPAWHPSYILTYRQNLIENEIEIFREAKRLSS